MADNKEKKVDSASTKESKDKAPAKKGGIVQYFKETRAEFKKVTWPTPKQVRVNTGIVLSVLTIAGLAIWGLDLLLNEGFRLLMSR